MPSYTEEQKRIAIETVEECGGSVTQAMRRLGYPTRQTLYHLMLPIKMGRRSRGI